MRWRQFCAELLAACDDLGGELVITLGALLADTPHTRPIPVTGTATEPDLVDRLKLEQSTYEGPTGIVGVFQDACVRLDIPAVSYWAAVPHYVAQPPCPKATLALLGQLEELLEARIPLGDLPEDARAWERGVDELAEEDEDVADYVRALEETRDTADLPEATRRGDRPRVRALPQAPRDRRTSLRPRSAAPPGAASGVGPGGDDRQSARPRAASSSRRMVAPASGSLVSARPVVPSVASTQPSTAATAVGASRSSARAASTASTTGAGRRAGAQRQGAAPGGRAVSTASQSSVVGPLPVAAVVVAQQRQPDRHRVDARCCAARRRRRGCPCDFDIFSPS